ncbi:2Fe-2S iron-sulfur cluster-binding protein [Paenibacillus thermoaerophilus]|jgi:2Fe-2S ferredoxin|uniref:2Fe-2S iron-sulfur cluster-binding protein n=1 Tax=Paenibacillus thermoaerophilus TaxID=1215385 RepID=A0ABW2V574_9BACL|nr:2Fe-2S iron-sulfur cluster-binding protein [Paenibacillus thermoaerophilus]TMV18719.1 (2Fe-2S)-binding protein [Paenibacillus thermoaerophilus]
MAVTLIGRAVTREVASEPGETLLELALRHGVDWGSSCRRGTCARCRCLIESGMEHLHDITDEEWDRLDEDEMERGFRLGCQAVVKSDGPVVARWKPYF